MRGYKYKAGDRVMYHGEEWIVDDIAIEEIKEPGEMISYMRAYRISKRAGEKLVRRYALENQISDTHKDEMHELTAAEYAEKLKAVFGNETAYSKMSMFPCRGRECRDCPFSEDRRKKEGYNGGCIALMLYRPDLAVKLMDEWQAEKSKPKGKTYLEDFQEKMPNAYIDPNFGTPAACRKRMYYHEIDDLKCRRKNECSKCWNEVMPEADDADD